MLLGEANVEPEQIRRYYDEGGMHMLFNFIVNQNLWLALAREEAAPLVDAIRETATIPGPDRWGTFLRNNDELDLGRLSDDDRRFVFRTFARSPRMQLYDRGIRRRLAPMLGDDRRRLELAFALLLALPGTPVVFYGDEIGMGDDLALEERNAVRTPMQWSPEPNGGFSTASKQDLVLPVISRGPFGFRSVNVADQRRDPSSLLHFVRRAVRVRREQRELTTNDAEPLRLSEPSVFGVRYGDLVALHNLSGSAVSVRGADAEELVDVFADQDYPAPSRAVALDGYGFRWLARAT